MQFSQSTRAAEPSRSPTTPATPARLNTDRLVRDTVRCLKRGNDPLWDGVSPFTARAATETE